MTKILCIVDRFLSILDKNSCLVVYQLLFDNSVANLAHPVSPIILLECNIVRTSPKTIILVYNKYFKWRTIRCYMFYSICLYLSNWWFQMFLLGLVSLECKQLRAPMLAPRRHQSITWTNRDFSAVKFCGIHPKAIHCKCPKSIIRMCYTITPLRLPQYISLERHLGPLLLTWFNFNPSMDK